MGSNIEEKFGKRFTYEKEFDGPVKERSCTDVICLVLFVLVIITWVYAIAHAILLGDPDSLYHLAVKNLSLCGSVQFLKGKPVLYISDIKQCKLLNSSKCTTCLTKKVSLEDCESLFTSHFNEKETHSFENWSIGISKFSGNSTASKSVEETQTETIKDHKTQILNRELNNSNLYKLAEFTLPLNNLTPANVEKLNKVSFFTESFEDLKKIWPEILMFWCIAIIASALYLLVIYLCLPVILWVSIIGVTALLIFGATMSIMNYLNYDASAAKADYSKSISSTMWMIIFIICLALLVILIIVLIALRKRIKIAVDLIKEACRCLRHMFLTVIFPVFPLFFHVALTVIFLVTLMFLYTSAHKDEMINDCNETSIEYKKDNTLIIVLSAINILSFCWSTHFVSALSDLILAGVFCKWYWAPDKSSVHNTEILFSTYRTFRYHLGTAAFGSIIIAIFSSIRILLHFISNRLKAFAICMWPLKCMLWIIEKFLNYLNRNGYIMCALHGSNYIVSAKNAYFLLMRNILRVFVLNNVIAFIVLLGKLLVAIGLTVGAYYYFQSKKNAGTIFHSVIPTLLVALGSHIVATHFLNLLIMAIDTIFLCFLEDCERNEGSMEKPFYMSTKLKEILQKPESA